MDSWSVFGFAWKKLPDLDFPPKSAPLVETAQLSPDEQTETFCTDHAIAY